MNNDQSWQCKEFAALTGGEVYDMLQLRAEIFVVEQACAYQDPDGLDQTAWHWLYHSGGKLGAYQRCMPPGIASPAHSAIGRVVVAAGQRGSQIGRELVRRGIAFNLKTWPDHSIQIGAQAYLENFYGSLGFRCCGEAYLEDGIPHLPMRLAPH